MLRGCSEQVIFNAHGAIRFTVLLFGVQVTGQTRNYSVEAAGDRAGSPAPRSAGFAFLERVFDSPL